MITLVDYGLGNIQAFSNIFNRLGIEVEAARTPTELQRARKIILPGVGAFDWAMSRLNDSGLRETLDDLVLAKGVDVLGVCVGMQLMAKRSEEGSLPGLGWLDAEVLRFDTTLFKASTHLPHMGWNDVHPVCDDDLFKNIQLPRYYFLHSYYIAPGNSADTLATANYSFEFTAAIRSANVYGTQFHPEKSHQWGIDLLKNFSNL
jgi:glutamine amidotransferase